VVELVDLAEFFECGQFVPERMWSLRHHKVGFRNVPVAVEIRRQASIASGR
jgi:hypothetical protein